MAPESSCWQQGRFLAFAVDYDVSGIEVSTIGWILMAAGALAIILFLTVWGPRSRAVDRGRIVEERRVYDDRPPAPGRNRVTRRRAAV